MNGESAKYTYHHILYYCVLDIVLRGESVCVRRYRFLARCTDVSTKSCSTITQSLYCANYLNIISEISNGRVRGGTIVQFRHQDVKDPYFCDFT